MPDVFDPGRSILETYLTARKDKLDRERQAGVDATNKAAQETETDFRKKQADNLSRQFDDEHNRQLAELDSKKAALVHAHHSAKLEIIRGIHEGAIPVPGQEFNSNAPAPITNVPQGVPQIPGAALPQGQFQNAPVTFGDTTVQGNEYNTPPQTIAQNQPIVDAGIKNAGAQAKSVATGTTEGVNDVNSRPGGLYEQQQTLKDLDNKNKLEIANAANDRAITIANARNVVSENNSKRQAAARLQAAHITKEGKGVADADMIAARMKELEMGDGPPPSVSNKIDQAARTALIKSGKVEVSPATVKRVDSMAGVEDLADQMKKFSDTYLGGYTQAAKNQVKSVSGHFVGNEYQADSEALQNMSTKFAQAIEGATGRTVLAQIKLAGDYLKSPNATKATAAKKIEFLESTVLHTMNNILGTMPVEQKVEYLSRHGLPKYAKMMAEKAGIQDKQVTGSSDDQWEDVTPTKGK